MLDVSSQDAIRHWVRCKFDLASFDVSESDVELVEHSEALADYHGVYVWRMGQKTVVSVPVGAIGVVRDALSRQFRASEPHAPFTAFTALTHEAFWRAALGERVERVVGPSYQGFLDREDFQSADTQGARPLTLADHHMLRAFIAACPPGDWEDSAIVPSHLPIFGLERDGALISVASAPFERPRMVAMRSVGVVTLPASRGTGAGRAVVGALTAHCLADGALLHYQTLRANLASVAIARALGYQDVATALGVRLNTASHG